MIFSRKCIRPGGSATESDFQSKLLMIVFVQPFGLNSSGGGPRILRALLQDAPEAALSVCCGIWTPPPTSISEEVFIPSRPNFGRIETTRFARYLNCTLPAFQQGFMQKLQQVCVQHQAAAIHAIPQGMEFWYAYQVAQKLGIGYYLNVHDDLAYNLEGQPHLTQAFEALRQAWQGATGRLVISEEMGQEYCRRYGRRDYAVVTDGLSALPAQPKFRDPSRLRVYFGGALHLSYQPNVESLMQALALLKQQQPELAVSLVCRGSSIASQRGIPVDNRPWASEAEVAQDLEDVDLLYLPLPFAKRYEAFSRFSLSTKMVTYLGSGLPILYHGPAAAAAGKLLSRHEAAVCVTTLEPTPFTQALAEAADTDAVVRNALRLGQQQFMLEDQRRTFWNMVGQRTASTLCEQV